MKKKARMLLKNGAAAADKSALRTPTTQEIIEGYHQGDENLRVMVFAAARALGLSLYNFLNILNINQIHLYGRSCGFGEAWLSTVLEQSGLNPFDKTDSVKTQATHIGLGTLSREQQIMGIGYLYVEQALENRV